ncbi:SDR family oxidoreductase [Streptomyces flaveus]|jgi:NADP-dependent 3-hydroxy acid dehydrogenase YdfG|uniref:SDR family oxidoreductase n=1 Tax=Streptomyces flaveus TaxID=66370 RepID=UPI003328DE83
MNTVTLITGGSTGIGAATARRLLKEGHKVAVTGRGPEKLTAFVDEQAAGTEVMALPGDTSDAADVQAAIDTTVQTWGRLDNVVINAGFSLPGTLTTHTPDEMRAMVLTNVLGPALVVRASLPHLKNTKGRIVILGSVAGVKYTPGNLYSVTKWAAHALAENTRMAVTNDGVGVTLIAPGKVDTPFWDSRGGMPEGPAMTAENIAESILFALNQPEGVDINHIQMRPIGQVN